MKTLEMSGQRQVPLQFHLNEGCLFHSLANAAQRIGKNDGITGLTITQP
jgi:hypothetical protein